MKRTLEIFSYIHDKTSSNTTGFTLTENTEFFGKKSYCIAKVSMVPGSYSHNYDSYDSAMLRWHFLKRIGQIYERSFNMDQRFASGWDERLCSYDFLLSHFSQAADIKIEDQRITYFFKFKSNLNWYSADFVNNETKLPAWLVSKIKNGKGSDNAGLKIEIIRGQSIRVFYRTDTNSPELIETCNDIDRLEYIVSWRAKVSCTHLDYFNYNRYWNS